MSDIYTVAKGDNLNEISKNNHISIKDLQKINDIPDPNKLHIGQRIYLKKELVLNLQFLLQDAQRSPIPGLAYQLHFNSNIISGATGSNGLTEKIMTESLGDKVTVFVERLDKSLKVVATVVSGKRSKIVTITTERLKLDAKTEPHPAMPGQQPNPKEPVKPAFPPKQNQAPMRLDPPVPKTTPSQTPDGKPLTIVQGEIPNVDFLDVYNGESMAETDYEWAAEELGVELAAIKAFAVVESGAAGFFTVGKRTVPKILYERHKFSKLTGHQYSAKFPDISLPTAYYNAHDRYVVASADYKKSHGVPEDVDYYRAVNKKDSAATRAGAVSLSDMLKDGTASAEKDKYSAGVGSYQRLLKAYQLDQNAALESCSWGAFQIMGEYWQTMGYASAKEFTKSVSRSPREQIKSFVMYIKNVNPAIKQYLKKLDWEAAARAYNGAGYKENDYDIKLAAAYKKFNK